MNLRFHTAVFLFVTCCLALLFSCKDSNTKGFQKIGNHTQFKIISFTSPTNKIDDGDLIEFKCLHLKNNKDTLLADSTKLNELFNDTMTFHDNGKSEWMSLFKNIQEGDSCLVLYNSEAELSKRILAVTNKISKQDTIYTYLKVKHVYKGQQKQAYLLEENAIARYITFSKVSWIASEKGIYYRIIKPSQHEKLNYNDPIKLVYKGYFLNALVFDNYADINPFFEHKVGTQNQLIKGMEIALNFMSYGSEAEFIFPSALAFGIKGSSTGIVPGYKPVLYKVKILDVEL